MYKIMCFTVPAIMAVYVKKQLLKKEQKVWNILLEWLISFIIINILVVITALPLDSVIVTRCELGKVHIQYGWIAIVMSYFYAVILGVLGSIVVMSRRD